MDFSWFVNIWINGVAEIVALATIQLLGAHGARCNVWELIMVKLKSKTDKHANDNEKRRKSIKEKEKAKLLQSQIIKQALSNSSLSNGTSKKIVFNDDDEKKSADLNRNEKSTLFDSSDSENEDLEIREKSQFSGKKGFELLNLQSTYGNDERFKIDERFLEDEKVEVEDGDEKTANNYEEDASVEKAKQLKILESVLEVPVVGSEKEKNAKKRTFDMVRYDASNKDHEIYEIHPQTETVKLGKKRKEGRKISKAEREELPKPQVSKEKFYEVSSEIKNRFKEKNEEGGQFSLLQTYGMNGTGENEENEEDEEDEEEYDDGEDEPVFNDYMKEKKVEGGTESKPDKKEAKELSCESKREENGVTAKGIWKEPFFFAQDDSRFKEALEFINKKNSSEATEAAENYDKTRKHIREVLRLHLKKQLHKKDPFKNKIGGMNKKQLANSKLKNSRGMFNKRKPPKMNPARRA